MNNINIIFVHGAWQGKWAWELLTPYLESFGYNCYTFNLPGSGDDTTDISNVSIDSYVDKVLFESKKLTGRKILVGHSMGGMVVTATVNKEPNLFDQIIYICAFLPQKGESVFSLSKESHEKNFKGPQLTLINSNKQSQLIKEQISTTFFNDCKNIENYVEQFKPQAMDPILTPISIWNEQFSNIPKSYILCTRDKAVDPSLQKQMANNAGIVPIEINSGHEPFISMPEELAKIIHKEIAN